MQPNDRREQRIQYYQQNREKILAEGKQYYQKNKQYFIKKAQKYAAKHPDAVKAAGLKYSRSEKGKQRTRVRRQLPEVLKKYRELHKKRIATDPVYHILHTCRGRLHNALRSANTSKSTRTIELLGCNPIELKNYLEQQFKSGMNWSNYGHGEDKWHIDHIKPCALFNLTKMEEQKKCFHYTNLQPLWSGDNMKKGARYSTKEKPI